MHNEAVNDFGNSRIQCACTTKTITRSNIKSAAQFTTGVTQFLELA